MSEELNGIFVIDKPKNWTSHDVVAKLRNALGVRRIGYAGTLDPLATGVLPVFVGRATSAVDLMPNQSKVYLAYVQFGITSPTGDYEGPFSYTKDTVTLEALEKVLKSFIGPQLQLPPVYSAIKMGGEPLYKKARRGEYVKVQPRPIEIYDLACIGRLNSYNDIDHTTYALRIHCSKGTYIRSLVADIASRLDCTGILAGLRRTAACGFTFHDALPLWQVVSYAYTGRAAEEIYPVDEAFQDLTRIVVDEPTRIRLFNGCPTSNFPLGDGLYRVYDDYRFLGLANVTNRVLTVQKMFHEKY